MSYRGETLRRRMSLTVVGLLVITGIISACSPTDAREATPSATALVEPTKTPFEPTPAAVPPAKTIAPKETKSTTPDTPIYPRHDEDLPIINLAGTETINTPQHLSKEDQQLATYRDSEKSRIYMQLAEGSKTIKQKHEKEIAGFIIGTNWSELQPGEFLTSGFLTNENGVGYEYSYSIVTSNGVEKKGTFTLNPESLPTGTEYIYDTRNHGLLYQGQVSDDGPYTTFVARFDKQQGKVVESEVKFKISQIFNPKTEKWETPSATNGGIINLSGIGGAESPTETTKTETDQANPEQLFKVEGENWFAGITLNMKTTRQPNGITFADKISGPKVILDSIIRAVSHQTGMTIDQVKNTFKEGKTIGIKYPVFNPEASNTRSPSIVEPSPTRQLNLSKGIDIIEAEEHGPNGSNIRTGSDSTHYISIEITNEGKLRIIKPKGSINSDNSTSVAAETYLAFEWIAEINDWNKFDNRATGAPLHSSYLENILDRVIKVTHEGVTAESQKLIINPDLFAKWVKTENKYTLSHCLFQ